MWSRDCSLPRRNSSRRIGVLAAESANGDVQMRPEKSIEHPVGGGQYDYAVQTRLEEMAGAVLVPAKTRRDESRRGRHECPRHIAEEQR